MPITLNEDVAGRLDEVAVMLAQQGANHFRILAYQHAATALRRLPEPVSEIFARDNLEGLKQIPGVGETIAHAIRDILLHGKLAMLERLRGKSDPIPLLCSVPGIGKKLAWQLLEELGIESLQELEAAAHDGRLEKLPGLGIKRIAGIRDSLAHRLGRIYQDSIPPAQDEPSVAELLDVDEQYRREAGNGSLPKIAPHRLNPTGEAWLPVLHTQRRHRHFTAMFSNTEHAHQMGKTRDWVLLYYDGAQGEHRCTVITSSFGPLAGRRIVRGREAECERHYAMDVDRTGSSSVR